MFLHDTKLHESMVIWTCNQALLFWFYCKCSNQNVAIWMSKPFYASWSKCQCRFYDISYVTSHCVCNTNYGKIWEKQTRFIHMCVHLFEHSPNNEINKTCGENHGRKMIQKKRRYNKISIKKISPRSGILSHIFRVFFVK